jgi:hypothetical protein
VDNGIRVHIHHNIEIVMTDFISSPLPLFVRMSDDNNWKLAFSCGRRKLLRL